MVLPTRPPTLVLAALLSATCIHFANTNSLARPSDKINWDNAIHEVGHVFNPSPHSGVCSRAIGAECVIAARLHIARRPRDWNNA